MVSALRDLEETSLVRPIPSLLVLSGHCPLLFDGPLLRDLRPAQVVDVGHQVLNWFMHNLVITIHLFVAFGRSI